MWNNPHSLRYGWCHADSCSNIIKYNTDQSLIKLKRKCCKEHIIATLWWISSGLLFMTARHFFGWFHWVECVSYRGELHLQMLGALASKVTSKTSLRCGWTGGSHQLTSLQQLYDIIVESMPWRLEAVLKGVQPSKKVYLKKCQVKPTPRFKQIIPTLFKLWNNVHVLYNWFTCNWVTIGFQSLIVTWI